MGHAALTPSSFGTLVSAYLRRLKRSTDGDLQFQWEGCGPGFHIAEFGAGLCSGVLLSTIIACMVFFCYRPRRNDPFCSTQPQLANVSSKNSSRTSGQSGIIDTVIRAAYNLHEDRDAPLGLPKSERRPSYVSGLSTNATLANSAVHRRQSLV